MIINDSVPVISLSLRSTILTLVAFAVTYIICYITYQRLFSPFRRVPGPFLASLTRYWQLNKTIHGNWHEEVVRLHEKYGEIVRIAPNEISFTAADVIKKAYGHTGQPFVKDSWYHTWYIPNTGHGVFAETEISDHRNLRRRVSKAYTMTYILAMEQYMEHLVELFCDKMTERQGLCVNMTDWTQFFAFDIIGELAFGQDFGLLKAGWDIDGLCNQSYLFMACTSMMGWSWMKSKALIFPWWHWVLNKTFLKRVNTKITEHPIAPFGKVVTEKLKLRQNSDRQDLLAHFSQMKNSDGSAVREIDVFFESMNVVGAGADTTAISMRAILRYVCSYPRVYQKLQKEIDEASAAGRLSNTAKFAEAQELPYFQAVMKEALRLFPAVGFQLPRVVPSDGVEIRGIYLPPKTIISVNGWAIHRNKRIFGEDAYEFRPERWLEGDTKAMDNCYASFGFGSRTCIGKNLALLEMNKLLPTLLRNFDIEICDAEKPWEIVSAWFAYQTKFNVRLRKRTSSTNVQGLD